MGIGRAAQPSKITRSNGGPMFSYHCSLAILVFCRGALGVWPGVGERLLASSPSTSFTLHVLLFIKLLHSFQKVSTLRVGGDVHSPVPMGPSPPTHIYKITICQLGCGTTLQEQIFIAPSKKYQLNFCPHLRFFLNEVLTSKQKSSMDHL